APHPPLRGTFSRGGEGSRDGRMRGSGSDKGHVLRRRVDVEVGAPHPPLRGTFSRGEKGEAGSGPGAIARRGLVAPGSLAGPWTKGRTRRRSAWHGNWISTQPTTLVIEGRPCRPAGRGSPLPGVLAPGPKRAGLADRPRTLSGSS